MTTIPPFTPAQRATLDALCRRIVPAAYDGAEHTERGERVEPRDAPRATLADLVEERVLAGDVATARDLTRLLDLWNHPLVALLAAGGGARRFTARPPAAQDAWLDRWAVSGVPPLRTAYQALRRLVLSTFYAQPWAQAEVGYLGPFHERAPVFPWEGVLPGQPSDAEPVARGIRLERAPLPRPRPAGVLGAHELGAAGVEARFSADVCVIGSGAGGAVAAARLAEAGREVILLEEGGWWTAADFTEREAEMMPRLYADRAMRATDDLSVTLLQGRSVGGGTTVNWMLMLRAADAVLDEWAEVYGAEGVGAVALAPVYDRIGEEVHARLVPDDAHSAQNDLLLEGARRLGWRARAARINAEGCVRAGSCGLGCRWDAKRGMHLTFVPRLLAAGGRVLADVRATRIEVLERGGRTGLAGTPPLKRVHAAVLDPVSGAPRGRVTVEAPVVVLAGGAVETPALLARSGLAGGGVGRFLRLHPTSAVVGRYARGVYGAAGIPQSSLCDEFLAGDGDGYGFWIEAAPIYPALASVVVPGFGAAHRAIIREFPRLAGLITLVRDGAERDRSQGVVRLDRRGRVRIRYRLGEPERRQLARGIAATARLHLAAGATEVLTLHSRLTRLRSEADLAVVPTLGYGPNEVGLFSAHVNGTCRLGRDPRTSGCTPQGERHGVPGLYVADGSLLPTAPGVNPQWTIMAVASVVADGIADRHRA